MAGYSGTSLPRKLGISPGALVAIVGEPEGFRETLGPLPPGARVRRRVAGGGPHDIIVYFCTRRSALERRFAALSSALSPAGGLWVAWPKRSSKVATDLSENLVREIALAAGLVDNKVCAIDEVWSGLRLVRRLADRPGR
jgi:hypothetical protein